MKKKTNKSSNNDNETEKYVKQKQALLKENYNWGNQLKRKVQCIYFQRHTILAQNLLESI